jgi:steroid delta-isomerase-like uncharacterized protein
MQDENNFDQNILLQNKEIVRRYYEECWNQGKVERAEQYIAKDCRYHDPAFPSMAPGVDSMKRHISMCRNAFPDLRFGLDDMIAERDEVVVHWTAHGTQEGQFLGISATRKIATVGGTSIYRIKNQKIVEQFADWNLLTLLEQLGVATAPKVQATAR